MSYILFYEYYKRESSVKRLVKFKNRLHSNIIYCIHIPTNTFFLNKNEIASLLFTIFYCIDHYKSKYKY